jgi:AcrR family transcriptional regulator
MSSGDTEATTQRIRDAALRLFAERGFGNTTIEHISTAADVGVATIYRRWSDKAAIGNELYSNGVHSMLSTLDETAADNPRALFIALWRRLWEWATDNRDLVLFVTASTGAPWLTEHNTEAKAELTRREVETYAKLGIDTTPDFAAALIGGTLASLLATEPDIEPEEVAERLWRALTSTPS